jgi:predicted Ser/Thr protein kinase
VLLATASQSRRCANRRPPPNFPATGYQATIATSAPLRLPSRYRDPQLIARGGMGEVYRATDTTLDRTVAVKVLDDRFGGQDVRRRFTREGLAAARLSSGPSTVTIYDVGECDGRPFIVMEHLAGGSLEDVLAREGAQPPSRALEWLDQTAHALDHAHAQGVVHRDVKPANLLLGRDGNVRVADFGVARAVGLDSVTQTGQVIGTAGYLSPEQASGKDSTPASDRYALGVVAYELLTGARPFQRSSPSAEAAAHIRERVPPVGDRRPGLPPTLDSVFARALAKSPADRYDSAEELVASLRAAFADDAGATRVLTPTAPTRVARRRGHALPLALVAAILLGAGAIAAVLLARGDHQSAPEPQRVVTVTAQGTTVRETVTAQAQPTAPATTAAPTATTPSGASAASDGYAKMQAGDYSGALPLLRQAAADLQGSGGLDEAYNDYNLAFTLTEVEGCSQQVLDLLDRSEAIQGKRKEIGELRKACRKAA